MKKANYIFIMIILLGTAAYAQTPDDEQIRKLAEKVEKFEKQINLDERFKTLSEKVGKDINEITDNKIKAIENKYESDLREIKNDIKMQKNIFYIVLAIIFAIGVWNLLSFIIMIPQKIENKIDEKIENFFKEKIKFIKELIIDQEFENRIKAEKRILVLGNNEQEVLDMRDRFGKLKFANVNPKLFDDVFELEKETIKGDFNENEYDLIIFNRLEAEQIDMYMNVSSHEIFIGYSLTMLNVKQRERLNFANSPFTLYARTIETLKYQQAVQHVL